MLKSWNWSSEKVLDWCVLYFSLLLLGELLVDEVDLVDILGDPVITEETVVAADNTREVLELKVLRVQTELGEETRADIGPAPDGPHHLLHVADTQHGPTRVTRGNTVVVGDIIVIAHTTRVIIAYPVADGVAATGDVAEVIRVELEGIRPVGVLQVVQDTLGRRAHLLGVELHCHGSKGLQALRHLLGVNLVAVLLQLIHLVGRKECGHFVCLGLCYPFSTFSKSIFDGSKNCRARVNASQEIS